MSVCVLVVPIFMFGQVLHVVMTPSEVDAQPHLVFSKYKLEEHIFLNGSSPWLGPKGSWTGFGCASGDCLSPVQSPER